MGVNLGLPPNAPLKVLRSKLLRPYRARRTTPRPDSPGVFEDPAPPWGPSVVDALLRYARDLREVEEVAFVALRWCEEGDAPSRAEMLLTVLANWPGDRVEGASLFLERARKLRFGPAAGARPKPARVVRVQRTWDDPPARDVRVLRRIAEALASFRTRRAKFSPKTVEEAHRLEALDLDAKRVAEQVEVGIRYAIGEDVGGRIPDAILKVILDAYGYGEKASVMVAFEEKNRSDT